MTRPSLLGAACAIALLGFAERSAAVQPPPQEPCTGGAATLLHRFDGQFPYEFMGGAVASLGDVNRDGVPDLAIGAKGAREGGFIDSGVVIVFCGATGSELRRFPGPADFAFFGHSVAAVEDLDGDGVHDLVVGAPTTFALNQSFVAGSAFVYSTANGVLIHRFDGWESGQELGYSVAGLADMDGDGVAEIAVGAPGSDVGGPVDSGSAFVYSGSTGTLLRQFHGSDSGDEYGTSVAAAGDVDGDGTGDLMVGAPFVDGTAFDMGAVDVFSGRTGARIHRFMGSREEMWFGYSVASAGDVDGDGVGDVLVGAPSISFFTPPGAAAVYSGAHGGIIHAWQGQQDDGGYGWSVASAGDTDGDGRPDLVVGAPSLEVSAETVGVAFLYAGPTGALLHRISGPVSIESVGTSVAGVGDMDGNRREDLFLGASGATASGYLWAGAGLVYSFDPFLFADAAAISASAGGTVHYAIDFPSSEAGVRYALRGSWTGRGPWAHDGSCLPLTPDALTWRMATGNAPWFTNTDGRLDAQGHATVTLGVPPNSPAMGHLIGTTLWFAAYTRDAGARLRLSSVAVPLDVVP